MRTIESVHIFCVLHTAMKTPKPLPYHTLGNLIAALRVQAGLAQQSDLAVLARTTQQTISRWEAGSSRPRVEQIPLLSSALNANLEELLAAAGYTPQLPVATFDQPFPIDALNPDTFERFCLYFISNLHPTAQVHRVGGQGHTQDGLDVDAVFPDGTCFTFQCKRVQDFGPTKVHAAVKAHTRPAEEKYLLLTRPAASPQARLAIRDYERWDIWDREDVSRMIRQYLSKDQQLRLVDTFFRGQRLALLGETEAGPWQTTSEFFDPFASELRAFNHQWNLVGRNDDVAAILKALTDPSISATFLIGPGGSGKSRVLKQAINVLEYNHPEIMVRFLSPTNDATNKSLEDLGGRRKLLIIDDAHDRESLQLLFQYVAAPANKATLLLSFRPYGLNHIKGQASTFALAGDCVVEHRLNPLSVEQTTQLARQVLTKFDGPIAATEDIARLTLDCPLFTVIGAQVVSAEKLPLELVKKEDLFRSTLMGKFQDVVAGHIGSKTDAPFIKKLLNVLALVQPFHIEDITIQCVAEQVEGLPPPDTCRLLRLLVEAGVIFKRGGKYRLSPDLLADYIIEQACIGVEERSTGYAERVFDAMPPGQVDHVLLNLGKLDWRRSNGDPSNSRLLDGIWSKLKPSTEYADPHVAAVTAVAYYQPQRALRFAENLIWEGAYLRDIPTLLRNIAYNLDYVRAACECLWELGKMDTRALNSNPGHAIRIMAELCAVEPNKPIAYNEAVVQFAIDLVTDDSSWEQAYSPFDILKGIVLTEGHTTTSTGKAVTFSSFLVKPEAVSALRASTIDVAISLLVRPNLKAGVLAAKFLHECLRYPMGMFKVQLGPEARDGWVNEFVTTLEKMERQVRSGNVAPVVLIEIIKSVSWHALYANGRTTPIAERIVEDLPDSLEFRTVLALMDGYGRLVGAHEDIRKRQEELQERTTSLTNDLLAAYPEPQNLLRFIGGLLRDIHRAGSSSSPYGFLETVIHASYGFAKAIVEAGLQDVQSPTTQFAGIALGRLLEDDRSLALVLAGRYIGSGARELQAAVGRAYCVVDPKASQYAEEDLLLIRAVLTSKDAWVVQHGIEAVRSVARSDRSLAVELLKCVDMSISARIADDLCLLFQRDEMIPFKSLSPEDIEYFLSRLMPIPQLDGYWIETFLARASKHHAIKTAAFFMARLELAVSQEDWGFRACNHGPYVNVPLRFREAAEFGRLLRQVSERLLVQLKSNQWAAYRAGEVFDAMFGPFDEELLTFIQQWADVGSADDIRLIAHIVAEANPDLVIEHRAYVVRLIETASKLGSDMLDMMVDSLYRSAISGLRTSTPGKPSPRDTTMRDEAKKALQDLPKFAPARRLYELMKKDAQANIADSIRQGEIFEDE